jgi:hypothetical protein
MRLIAIILLTLSASGCQQSETPNESEPQLSEVVASIDGKPIYQAELALVINQTLGEFAALQLGSQGRKKVLESLIIRKLMSDQQWQLMDEEERQQLDLELNIYREELLTKRHVREHLIAEPVNDDMIQAYYANNPSTYGAKTLRRFEMVRADVSRSPVLQKDLSLLIQGLTPHSDWKLSIDQARQQGLPIFLVSGHSAESGLIDDYQQIIQSLAEGEISPLHSINGILVRFRVTELIQVPAKPIEEVSKNIRKTLAPLQLKKAIQQEAELLMRDREIERYAMD